MDQERGYSPELGMGHDGFDNHAARDQGRHTATAGKAGSPATGTVMAVMKGVRIGGGNRRRALIHLHGHRRR